MFTMTNFASNILDMVFYQKWKGTHLYKALSGVTGYVPQIHLSASSLSHLI